MHLHEIGFDEKPCFAAAGTADHQHVFIAGVGGILGAAIQHEPFALGENDVILRLWIHIGRNILPGAPAGRAVFHILAELLGVLTSDIDHQPHERHTHKANQIIKTSTGQDMGKGKIKSGAEPQQLFRGIRSRCKPDGLSQLGEGKQKNEIRQIGQQVFLQLVRGTHSSGPPWVWVLTFSLPMDNASSLNL